MSRSRINYDKARRDANARAAHNPLNQPIEREINGIPAHLHEALQGKRLKPALIKHFLSGKGLRPEWRPMIMNFIVKSDLRVFAEETREDGTTCSECEMKIQVSEGAMLEYEHFRYFLGEIGPIHDQVGSQWVMRFWFPQAPSEA